MVISRCSFVALCNPFLFVILCIGAVSPSFGAGRLVINEVMINEPGSETSLEWVELFNAGDDSLNLKNCLFIEAADTTRFSQRWLSAGAFIVLSRKPLSTDGTASFERQWGNASNVWGDDSLENYLLLQARMSLRNSNDSVTIVDLATGQIETVRWDSSPPDGVSLERVNPFTAVNGRNFKTCRAKTLATPGAANSVLAKSRDLGLLEDACEIFVPATFDQSLLIRAAVTNRGLTVVPATDAYVVVDRNINGRVDQSDSAIAFMLPGLLLDSTVTLDLELVAPPGHRAYILMLPPDDDSTNNRMNLECVVGARSEEIQVSEIMNNSDLAHGGEWLEVAGVVDYELNLSGWKLEIDGIESSLDSAGVLPSRSRTIICQDSSALRQAFPALACPLFQPRTWHGLGNGSGTLLLRMGLGAISDSVGYSGGTPQRSWERDPDSTSQSFVARFYLSTDSLGATPCQINSPRPIPVGNDLAFVPGSLALGHTADGSDLIDVSCQIANNGYRDATPTRIEIVDDTDRDSLFDTGESAYPTTTPAIKSHDTATVALTLDLTAGRHLFIFRLPDDEVPFNNVAFACITSGNLTRELEITEFIADPVGPLESEWVEIKNSSRFPVSLAGWSVGDQVRQSPLRSDLILSAGEYCVIAQDSAAFGRYYGGGCTPVAAANWSNLNNGGDGVVLRDEYGTISDSLFYIEGAGNNHSLARNEANIPGVPGWFASVSPGGSTPCRANDLPVPLPAHDLGIVAGEVILRKNVEDPTQVLCTLRVVNNGYLLVAASQLEIFGGSGGGEELIAALTIPPLQPGDTAALAATLHLETGRHVLMFLLGDDDDVENNQATESVTVGRLTHEFAITEILADPELPLATEWVEICNRSLTPLNLNGWSLGDGSHQHPVSADLTIRPGSYAILAADSAAFAGYYGADCSLFALSGWPGLNNNGDVIVLVDEFGTVSDSVRYLACAGGNRSLECNESDSIVLWYPSTAEAGATPCDRNAVSNRFFGVYSIELLNRVFAPSAGEQLRYLLQCPPATKFTIEVYDLEGRRQRTVAGEQYYSSGEFAYDGASDYFDRLPVGAYVLKIESEDGAFARKLGFAVALPR